MLGNLSNILSDPLLKADLVVQVQALDLLVTTLQADFSISKRVYEFVEV